MGKHVFKAYKIKAVMSNIERGAYSIPPFQRNFVWKAKKILALINSVTSNFPIGSITSAHSNDELKNGNSVLNYIVDEWDLNCSLIIDGQQRLTALSIIWFSNIISSKLKSQKTKKTTSDRLVCEIITKTCFYNGELMNLSKVIDKLKQTSNSAFNNRIGMLKHEASKYTIDNKDINEKVREKIGKYEINFIYLDDWNLEELIDIFQAINLKTTPLTHVDLMNGSIYSITNKKFKLLDFIKSSNTRWKPWGIIKPPLFVILMKIYYDLKLTVDKKVNYKKDALIKWANNSDEFNNFCNDQEMFIDKIISTFKLLKTKLFIIDLKYLPKEVYLLVIFSLSCLKDDISKKDFDLIFRNLMFAVSTKLINGVFASSPNAKAMEIINNIIVEQIIENKNYEDFDGIKNNENWEDTLEGQINETTYKNRTSAIFKFIHSALCSMNPKKIFNYENVIYKTNINIDTLDIHHFLPTNSQINDRFKFHNIDNVCNLTLFDSSENKYISNRDISEYINEAIQKNKNFEENIKTHLFDYDLVVKLAKYKNMSDKEVYNIVNKLFEKRTKKIIEKVKLIFFNKTI